MHGACEGELGEESASSVHYRCTVSLTAKANVLDLNFRNGRLGKKLFRGGIGLLMYVRNSASVSLEGLTLLDELQFMMLPHFRISNHDRLPDAS